MHRATFNELRLDYAITTVSPLCIQARDTKRFVTTTHPGNGGLSVYVPAATLKGTMRSAAEHVIGSSGLDCSTTDKPCSQRENLNPAATSADLFRGLRMCGSVF